MNFDLSDAQDTIDLVINYLSIYGLKVLAALVIFLVGKWFARKGADIVKKMMIKAKMDATLVHFLGSIIYILSVAFVTIAALSQIGIETTSLAAIIAAAGLAIGLAMQDSLSNLAAGVMLIFFKPFKAGDYIEAAGTAGTVKSVSIFTTTMTTPDNTNIIVPNGNVISGNIQNFSAQKTRRIDLVIGVGYDDDLKKVRKTLEEVLSKEPRILKDPAPVIAVSELADSSVNFVVRPWVKTTEYWPTRFDLIEAIKTTFDKKDISIPYPQRDVHVHANDDVIDAAKKAAE